MPFLVADFLRALAAVCLAAGGAGVSYAAAAVVTGSEARTSVRWSAAAIVAAWLQVALFWLTTPFGGFRTAVVFPLIAVAVLAAALWPRARRATVAAWDRDRRRVRELAGRAVRRPAGWAAGLACLPAALQWLRGTAAPPLGWDGVTYHLYRAGRWVQHGSLAPIEAPDAWTYYEYFPVVGDIFWSWAMLPLRSDALVATAGLLIWIALVLGVYATARELDAPADRSLLAAVALGSLPSSLPFISSSYVDNTVTALFTLGALFAVRAWRRRRLVEAPLAAAAFGLMLGAKPTTAAVFGLAAVVVLVAVVRAADDGRAKRLAFFACVLAAIAGYPGYQRAWVEHGSPFHPYAVSLGGVVLSEGVEATSVVLEDLEADPNKQLPSRWAYWRYFLLPSGAWYAFLNPGLGAAILGLLGLFGLWRLLRWPGRRVEGLFLLGCALLMVLFFLSGGMAPFRTTMWVWNSGRYGLPGFAAMAMLGAVWDGRFRRVPPDPARNPDPARTARLLWILVLAINLASAGIRGLVHEELAPDAKVLAVSLVAAEAAWLLVRRRTNAVTASLAALGLAAGLTGVQAVRDEARYRLYRATVDVAPVYHLHPLNPAYAAAWPIWETLDPPPGGDGLRIAVTAGWDGLGHNWYWYPLMGDRLENEVTYVPVTADGTVFDYREIRERLADASFPAWVARLAEERIDWVVSLNPRTTVEEQWMRQSPRLFTPVVVVPGKIHVAYRFDRRLAEAALAAATSGAGPEVPAGEVGGAGEPPPK